MMHFKTWGLFFLMLGNKIWGQKKIVFLENHCRILSQLGEGRLVVPRNKIGNLGEGTI